MSATPGREPLFKIPLVIVATIGLCVLVHVARSFLGREADFELIARYAFVPARLTAVFSPSAVAAKVVAWMQSGDQERLRDIAALRFFLVQPISPFLTLVSYAALHGDWTHLGFNSLWLLAFGTPVARRFGPWRFTAFLVVTAVAGALAHWAVFPFGTGPVIGASAAVSGCMGAAIRFVFEPAVPVIDGAPIPDRPAAPLSALFRNRRALSFLVVWFGSNALFGIGSVGFGMTDAPVAWQAHIGGFLAGLFLFPLFDRRPAAEVIPDPDGVAPPP